MHSASCIIRISRWAIHARELEDQKEEYPMKMRKLIAVMLALVLAFGLLPSMALADGELTVKVGETLSAMTYGDTAAITVENNTGRAELQYSIIGVQGVAEIVETTEGAVQVKAIGIGDFQVQVSTNEETPKTGTSAKITVSEAPLTIPSYPEAKATYNGTEEFSVGIAGVNGETVRVDIITSAPDVGVYTYGDNGKNTYTATSSNPNYTIAANDNGTFRITTRNLGEAKITLKNSSFNYDGTQKTAEIESVSLAIGGETRSLVKDRDFTVAGNTAANPGSHTLTITGKGNYAGTATATWFIDAPTPTYTAPAANTLTYNGLDQKLVTAGTTTDQDITFSYSTDGRTYYDTIPTGKNAGSYTVYWKAEKPNETIKRGFIDVTIAKAPLTVKADDTWVYAGDTPKFTLTITGYVNGENWRALADWHKLTFTCKYNEKDWKHSKYYTITPSGLTAANYTITYENGTLTVYDPLSPRFNVYVLDSWHGTVEADYRYARKDTVVTLRVKPDWGYELKDLTVTDSHGYGLKLTYHTDGSYTFTMPRDNVTVKATFESRDMPFVDVPGDAWYAGGVRYVYAHGLMNGTGNWRFSPNRTTTRAMVATILYRIEGSPRVYGSSQFTDVKAGSWYEDAVIWATQNGIVEGYSKKEFGADNAVTREQLAAMLYRYADYCRCDLSAGRYVDLSKFSDLHEISDYAIPALRWAVGEGILEGRTGKRLAPADTASRAEISMMLMRFCEDVVW